jgi:hypothetical protein
MSKSIEGLTIEELQALKSALEIAFIHADGVEITEYGAKWVSLGVDIQQQLSDQLLENEINDLPF